MEQQGMDSDPSDEALLAGFVEGQDRMFTQLVQRYERRLYGFIYRMVGHEADAADLFQETFVRAWRNADSFESRGSFRAWLYAIALNVCRSHRAKQSRQPATTRDPPVDLPNGSPLPDTHLASAEIGSRIARAVADLPDEQREVFVLKAYQDMAFVDIAAALRRPIGTVKSQMRYALQKLRRVLRDLAPVAG
jgi:RNA polymerase sigma-70 factor (ECF subfamily)